MLHARHQQRRKGGLVSEGMRRAHVWLCVLFWPSCFVQLNRGETLDALMDKSEDLSATSLTFYKQAKKQNQCCKAY